MLFYFGGCWRGSEVERSRCRLASARGRTVRSTRGKQDGLSALAPGQRERDQLNSSSKGRQFFFPFLFQRAFQG